MSDANVVLSTRLADARISYLGRGRAVRTAAARPGGAGCSIGRACDAYRRSPAGSVQRSWLPAALSRSCAPADAARSECASRTSANARLARQRAGGLRHRHRPGRHGRFGHQPRDAPGARERAVAVQPDRPARAGAQPQRGGRDGQRRACRRLRAKATRST